MIQSAVDFTAAAHAAAFDVGDLVGAHRDGLAAVAVFLHHFVLRKRDAGIEREVIAFLDEQHIASRFGEQAGGDGAAGAGTDDHDFVACLLAAGWK